MNKCLLMHSNNSMVLWFSDSNSISNDANAINGLCVAHIVRLFCENHETWIGLDTLYGVVCIIFIVILSNIIIITRGSRLIRFFFFFRFCFLSTQKMTPKKKRTKFSLFLLHSKDMQTSSRTEHKTIRPNILYLISFLNFEYIVRRLFCGVLSLWLCLSTKKISLNY